MSEEEKKVSLEDGNMKEVKEGEEEQQKRKFKGNTSGAQGGCRKYQC
ncbi:hypothetical protein [uncultured Holdemanella sp.]|mgnify:FL=1|nr:hypothetical protein [uncultured Holdemanella sp.]